MARKLNKWPLQVTPVLEIQEAFHKRDVVGLLTVVFLLLFKDYLYCLDSPGDGVTQSRIGNLEMPWFCFLTSLSFSFSSSKVSIRVPNSQDGVAEIR